MVIEIIKLVGPSLMGILTLLFFVEIMFGGSIIVRPLQEGFERRAERRATKERSLLEREAAEQRHRHRIELLQQLEKIAALEGLSNHEKNSEYAKLRDSLLAELDVNLEVAAKADAEDASAPKIRARGRGRKRVT